MTQKLPNTRMAVPKALFPGISGAAPEATDDREGPRPLIVESNTAAILAVADRRADTALVPFYDDQTGYDYSTLHDVNGVFQVNATHLVEAQERYCLAAYADDIAPGAAGAAPAVISRITASREAERQCRNALAGEKAKGAAVSIVGAAPSDVRAGREDRVGRGAGSAERGLEAMVLPVSVAEASSRYVVLRRYLGEKSSPRWLLGIRRGDDPSVRFDRYKTTDARTRYFCRRIRALLSREAGAVGVGVILRVKRNGVAAATADIEAFLKSHGVRFASFDLPPRDHGHDPAPRILDIEFRVRDFRYHPGRRLRGTIANGALKLAFARWKSRGVQVVGVMPLSAFRLQPSGLRKWWREGVIAAATSFQQTFFIRISQITVRVLALVILVAVFFSAYAAMTPG